MNTNRTACHPDDIIPAVARFYHVDSVLMRGPRKPTHIVVARHVAAYLMRTLTNLSLSQIGYRLGGRDHTTALNSVRAITSRIVDDKQLAEQIEMISKELLA